MRLEAQRKLKYHVSIAQKQIRDELNQRVKEEVTYMDDRGYMVTEEEK